MMLKKNLSIKPFTGETILEGMPELAYVFDKEGRMLMWNENVETILGYSKDELYLKTLIEFINKPDIEKTLNSSFGLGTNS